jgi:hypothetical protein
MIYEKSFSKKKDDLGGSKRKKTTKSYKEDRQEHEKGKDLSNLPDISFMFLYTVFLRNVRSNFD